jgi:hypothetical protein
LVWPYSADRRVALWPTVSLGVALFGRSSA